MGVMVMLSSLVSGCGSPMGSSSDPTEGKEALSAALDAWKAGETPDALTKRTQPIHMTDGDWLSGLRLQSYSADEGKLVGSDFNYQVALELKTPKGQVVKKTAVYAVTTHPQTLVLRQDSL